jgi:hypothetical protein
LIACPKHRGKAQCFLVSAVKTVKQEYTKGGAQMAKKKENNPIPTPVNVLWEGILLIPISGIIDSNRDQIKEYHHGCSGSGHCG